MDDRRSALRQLIELDSSCQSPAHAREAAAQIAAREQLGPVSDDLALVVSELVTNAVRHAEPPLRLEIQTSEHRVVVAVADGSDGAPAPRAVDSNAEGGRGMMLVDLLSTEVGVRAHPPGKTVWAALARR